MKSASNNAVSDRIRILPALFWGCMVPLALILTFDLALVLPWAKSGQLGIKTAIVLILLPKLAVVPWLSSQLLGTADRHFQRHGNDLVKNGLLAALLGSVLLLLVAAVESVQTLIFDAGQGTGYSEKILQYRFNYDKASETYIINGDVDFGISRDFRQFLLDHPGGRRLLINSPGGSIYEGRGLHQIISSSRLDTRVTEECSSACVLAFLGGRHRQLADGGRIGFHQYKLDTSNLKQDLPFYDAAREQQHDMKLMRGLGIDEGFLNQVFSEPHNGIWFPSADELLRAGIVHSVGR